MNRLDKTGSAIFIHIFRIGCPRWIDILPDFFMNTGISITTGTIAMKSNAYLHYY